MIVAGIDIGAVNVKVAVCHCDPDVRSVESCSFPFDTAEMAEAVLRDSLGPRADHVVATETVSFSRRMHLTYAQGLDWSCRTLERAFGPQRVWMVSTGSRLVPLAEARAHLWEVACRNWVATSFLATRCLNLLRDGLLVDCGTSSLDVVPVVGGDCRQLDGDKDQVWSRLGSGELTLTGTLLTSVQALTPLVMLQGRAFTTRSSSSCMVGHARVVAGEVRVEESVAGRSDDAFSVFQSRKQLAELVGADHTLLCDAELQSLARSILEIQQELVVKQVQKVRHAAESHFGRSLRQAVLCGLGARTLLSPALSRTDLELIDMQTALQRWVAGRGRLVVNCEAALGAALLGAQAAGTGGFGPPADKPAIRSV